MFFFDDDVRITLIVLQLNIKARLVVFDERILQQEGIVLCIKDTSLVVL